MTRILVVEDNDTLRRGVAQAFRDAGHEVEELADGGAAVERLGGVVYDVIITDLKLPKRSGLEVLRAAQRRNKATTVIVMTAYGTIATAVEAMKGGAYDFIQKPFNLEELEIKVNKALDHQRLVGDVEFLRSEQQSHYSWTRSSAGARKCGKCSTLLARWRPARQPFS